MTALRRLLPPLLVLPAMLLLPALAAAHAEGTISYEFPLPIWMYAAGGAVAVLASVPAAMVARPGRDRLSRNLYRPIGRLHLGAIGTALATLVLIDVIAGGLFGDEVFISNPATIVIWVDLWVGLGVVSALVGNIWDFTSPLSALARAIDGRLADRGAAATAYPDRLGMWPSVGMLIVWAWLELCWPKGTEPQVLAIFILGYLAVQVLLSALFTAEVWLPRGELFTAFARTLARMAPLELYVTEPAGPCLARSCGDDRERRGCASCWLAADREQRGLRLRLPGAGVHREAPLPRGGAAFVVALLATVVFDGFSNTDRYGQLANWLYDNGPAWLQAHDSTQKTIMMIAIAGGFALFYYLIAWLIGALEHSSASAAASRYAPSLIPIAAVYFIAHYLTYLIIYAQFTPGVLADPFEREWVPDYDVWTGLPSTLVWWLQVGLIVAGHIVAVFQAHRIAIEHEGPRRVPVRAAALRHAPLTALMIAYTAVGLWVLAQGIKAA
jgi:hypothetical protein